MSRGQDYISEEEDELSMSYDEGDFEMLGPRPALSARSSASTRRAGPAMKKIRVKVHADDTRYVLVGSAVEFRDFVDQIRKKFGLRQSFKIKIKDDSDMITMADQDDLEMAIETAKSIARKEKSDMGKMEVSCTILNATVHEFTLLTYIAGLDTSHIDDALHSYSFCC